MTLSEQFKALTDEIFELWDSDQDLKVGKMLRAFGGMRGYRPDVDEFIDRLKQTDGEIEKAGR